MKFKRGLSLILVPVLLIGLMSLSAFASTSTIQEPPEPPQPQAPLTDVEKQEQANEEAFGIAYGNAIDGYLYPTSVVTGKQADVLSGETATVDSAGFGSSTDIAIDLVTETLRVLPTEGAGSSLTLEARITHISVDGGTKWKTFSVGTEAGSKAELSKVLDKGGEIWFATHYDKKAKKPQEYVAYKAKDGDTPAVNSVAGSAVYKFQKIEARPKAPAFKPDYSVMADLSGATNGAWLPGNKEGTLKTQDELFKYDIAVTSNGKVPDAAGWGKIALENGINVQDMKGTKAVKSTFLMRVSPSTTGTLHAGSKAKKVTASSVLKAPKYKIDYKKELIKPKGDTIWSVSVPLYVYTDGDDRDIISEADWLDLVENANSPTPGSADDPNAYVRVDGFPEGTRGDTGEFVPPPDFVPMTKEDAKAGIKLIDAERKTEANPDRLYGETLVFRTVPPEGGKKPASAIQVATVSEVAQLYYSDVNLSVKKGKVTFDKKKFEFYDSSKSKWGNLPKDASTVKIRMKNTAKYDVKGNKTTGTPASRELEVELINGIIDEKKEKTGIVGWSVKYPTEAELAAGSALLVGEMILVGKFQDTITELKVDEPIAAFTAYTSDGKIDRHIGGSFTVTVDGDTGLDGDDFALSNDIDNAILVKPDADAAGKSVTGDLTITLKAEKDAFDENGDLEDYPKLHCMSITKTLDIKPTVTGSADNSPNDNKLILTFSDPTDITLNGKAVKNYSGKLKGEELEAIFGTINGTGGWNDGKVTAAYDESQAGKYTLTLTFDEGSINHSSQVTTTALTIKAGKLQYKETNLTVGFANSNTTFKIGQNSADATGASSKVTITIAAS